MCPPGFDRRRDLRLSLPLRHIKGIAYPPSGRAPAMPFVPNNFLVIVLPDPSRRVPPHPRAKGLEDGNHMETATIYPVGGAVVAGCAADTHPEGGGILEGLVHGLNSLGRPA